MKKFALTAAVALIIAAPALAQTQLERSVGAEPGQYSVSEQARLNFNQDNSGNEARVVFNEGSERLSARNRHSPVALEIFKRLAAEQRGNF